MNVGIVGGGQLARMLALAGYPLDLRFQVLDPAADACAGQVATLAVLIGLKLVVMPAIAWILATKVFALSPLAAGVVLILAAMPAGANAYLFAVRRGHGANSASGAVALGTVLAAGTVSVVLAMVRP